ncbi:MAG: sensor histidine kinase [Caulobacteraceae bacterium]|nr:sensor histidine kinase [Caulobacter sp.]
MVQRLVWLAAGWTLGVLLLTGAALVFFFSDAAVSRLDRDLQADADNLYSGSSVGADGQVLAPFLTDERAFRPFQGHYWQIGEPRADGRVHALPLLRSRSMWDGEDLPSSPEVVARLARRPSGSVAYNGEWHHQPVRIVAMQRYLTGHAGPLVFATAEDRALLNKDISRFAVTGVVFLLLVGAGLVAAVVLQVRVGLRPLFRMRADVARVRQGGAERLPTGAYPRELSPLAGELNGLLDHSREVVERQRTHVGNLAHALKTPISVMLSEAERQPGPLAEVVSRQAHAMQGQVDHHLRRARAAARAQAAGERTPVEPVLDELARTLDRIYGRRGVDIGWEAEPNAVFQGERQDLLEMVGNLLENACKYSGGEVQAQATAAPDGRLLIAIDDDGPGLSPAQRLAAVQRGQRLDETEPGSGLGLSIVDELARAYGGALVLESSELGGLRAELRLPRAAD